MEAGGAPLELLALAGGRLNGMMAMATPVVREAVEYRRLSAIWSAYRRDAGAGEVGRDHRGTSPDLLATNDGRRDGVLLWLIDHAPSTLSAAAERAARAVGARQRLDGEALELLAAAIDELPPDAHDATPHAALRWMSGYVGRLSSNPDFAEMSGEMVDIALPRGRLSTYRTATPGACWAANLALQARPPSIALPIPPGTLSRALFRHDLDDEERATVLRSDWLRGLDDAGSGLLHIRRDLERGEISLARLSKNARARAAWLALACFETLPRGQLARMLSVSRGGAAHISQQLVDAGLARIDGHGAIARCDGSPRASRPLDGKPTAAAVEVDQAMAEIDRLMTGSTH